MTTLESRREAADSPKGVPYLAARLARLALELDRVVEEIAAVALTDADALILSAPAAHLALASANLGEALYLVDRLDQRLLRLERYREAA